MNGIHVVSDEELIRCGIVFCENCNKDVWSMKCCESYFPVCDQCGEWSDEGLREPPDGCLFVWGKEHHFVLEHDWPRYCHWCGRVWSGYLEWMRDLHHPCDMNCVTETSGVPEGYLLVWQEKQI